jgi:hypothetical protein
MAKRASEDLKKLTALQASLVCNHSQHLFLDSTNLLATFSQPHQRTTLQKTSHDVQMSMVAFQRAQQVSAERQRTVVQGVKLAVEDDTQFAVLPFSISNSCANLHFVTEKRQRSVNQSNGKLKCFKTSFHRMSLPTKSL